MPDPPAEMSRRRIDRLGDRLRNDPSAEDVKLYAAYRDSLDVSLEQVAGTISGLRIGQLESRRLKRVESGQPTSPCYGGPGDNQYKQTSLRSWPQPTHSGVRTMPSKQSRDNAITPANRIARNEDDHRQRA